jgi:hypothetical protein
VPATDTIFASVYAVPIDVPCQTPVPIVPTDVREDVTTVLFSVVPVSVPAAAVTVIFAVPSKLTPLIVLAVASFVAVSAFPVRLPDQ